MKLCRFIFHHNYKIATLAKSIEIHMNFHENILKSRTKFYSFFTRLKKAVVTTYLHNLSLTWFKLSAYEQFVYGIFTC